MLRVQRKCSCGGTCAACQLKQRLGLQTKVMVGPVDDPYEREADRVAAHVMRMPRDGMSDTSAAHAGARIQRACSACGMAKADETIRRQATPQAHRDGGAHFDLSHTMLVNGGRPLSSPVQDFFESRFGRDFSGVRVHDGPLSERVNDSLSSYAFTYGHHVWLGRGQPAGATPLVAHELAHVVQQTGPRQLNRPGSRVPNTRRDTSHALRRALLGIPYFEPERRTGTGTHSEVLPQLRLTAAGSSGGSDLFIEAPVPNASEHGSGYGRTGRADLLAASTTVGVFFNGHNNPAPLSARGTRRNGAAYDHSTNAAPFFATRMSGTVTRTGSAPSSVRVGDLKPLWERAFMGRSQLQNYQQGFEMARTEVNQLSPSARDGTWGPLSTGVLAGADITVPPQYETPFTGQTGENVVLKMAGGLRSSVLWRPNPPISGRMAVRADPSNAGIWNYFWVPQTTVPTASLPTEVQRLGPEVTRDIVNPLFQDPLQVRRRRRPDAVASSAVSTSGSRSIDSVTAPQVRGDARGPVVRRTPIPANVRDPFDYDAWRGNLRRLTTDYGAAERTPGFEEAKGRLQAVEALEFLRNRSGMASAIPHIPDTSRQAQHELGKVDFWTGLSAQPFGLMRRIFGRAFVAVARFYIRVRDRFREALKRRRMRSSAPSGALGAALKAGFKVLKMATAFLIGRVVDRLWTSLSTGVVEKILHLIPTEVSDELQDRVDQVTQLRDDLERRALDNIEGWIREVIGPYEDVIRQVEEVQRIVSDITGLINLVRWGARVAACLSPPALGCLWILGEAALDVAAQAIVETCWFQRKITPLIAKVDFIREIPNQLAQMIVEKIRTILPDSLHDIFADIPDVGGEVRPEDVTCDTTEDDSPGGRYVLTAEREALFNMQVLLGEEKFQAFIALAQASHLETVQLSASEIRDLTTQVDAFTPAQLQAFALQYPMPVAGVTADFATAVQRLEHRGSPATTPSGPTPAPESSTDPAPDPVPGPAPAPTRPAPGSATQPSTGGGGPDDSTSGPGIPTARAADRVYDGARTRPLDGDWFQIVNAASSHTAGTRVGLDLVEFFHQDPQMMITDLPAVVERRRYFPIGAGEGNATHLVIHYRLERGVRMARGVLSAGRTICYYLPRGAGQSQFSGTRRCP